MEENRIDPVEALAKAKKCWDTAHGKNALNFLILRSIERKYYYYLSVRICKFLFSFVDECVTGIIPLIDPCPGTLLAGLFWPECRYCIQGVIFRTCLAEELCDSGLFETIIQFFKDKLGNVPFVSTLVEQLFKHFVGECK